MNNNNNPNENENENEDKWKWTVTQSDWSGPVMQGSWDGDYRPCRRLALWVHLSSVCLTLCMATQALLEWPMLQIGVSRDKDRLLRESHETCWHDVCDAVSEISFDCHLHTDGSVSLDPESLRGIPIVKHTTNQRTHQRQNIAVVPLPASCHVAIHRSFGQDVDQKYWPDGGWDLLHIPLEDEDADGDSSSSTTPRNTNMPLFQFLPNECMVHERFLEWLMFGNPHTQNSLPSSGIVVEAPLVVDLLDPLHHAPGTSQRIHLRNFACPSHMPKSAQKVLPAARKVYDFFWQWRISVTLCLLYWINMAYFSAMSATNLLSILLPGVILWWFVLRSKQSSQGRSIGLVPCLSTLLVLVTISDEGSQSLGEGLRTGLLVTSAYFLYDNRKAAFEWAFLYGLAYLDPSSLDQAWEINVLEPLEDFVAIHGAEWMLSILSGVETAVALCLPGTGVWKCVTLYVVFQALPRPPPTTSSTDDQHANKRD